MKKGKRFFRPFWALAISLSLLASCNESSSSKPSGEVEVFTESTNDGTPTTISIQQVDHIDPPEDFEGRLDYVREDSDQNEKFIFDAKPGQNIGIVNPSGDAISAEDIEAAVTIRDAFGEETNRHEANRQYLMQKAKVNKKSFQVCDPLSKRPLSRLEPNQHALLVTDEPTEGGDLTIITKDEYLPINFEDKNASVNELIVATERPDTYEFDPNDESILGLNYDLVVDYGDLEEMLEGTFLYRDYVELKEGDQFYLGENGEFNADATFYTFLDIKSEGTAYRIHYTAPDYSLCYNKLNIHMQEETPDFESEDFQLKFPETEDLVRSLNEEGGIVDRFENEYVPEAIATDPVAGPFVKEALQPGISATLVIDRVTINFQIYFALEGNSIVSNWSITGTFALKTTSAGTLYFRAGANIYYKQTYTSYMDYSLRWTPYPKLSYVVCLKTQDEKSMTFSAGVGYALKTDKKDEDKWDPGAEKDALVQAIKDAFGGKDVPEVEGGQVADAPAASERFSGGAKPQSVLYGKSDSKDTYTYDDHGFEPGDAKFVGDGIVISGFGGVLVFGPVTVEFGMSFYFTPNIQGRFFWNYSDISTSVRCKVANGFDTPEGYSEEVERSSSQHTLGLYVQLGFEVGFIFEVLLYITGTKDIIYISLGFTVGLYFLIQAVAIITWGDGSDLKGMGYFSVELGIVIRIQIRLVGLKKYFVLDIKTWNWKVPLFTFGANLHFLDFIDKRQEISWLGGKFLNINDFGILGVKYFSTDNFTVGRAAADWHYKAYFASAVKKFHLRLFCDLTILEGGDYISFNDDTALFTVKDGAPDQFDFKFKIYTDGWLGLTMPNKTLTVHYVSNEIRAINFMGYDGPKEVVDGAHVGGGVLHQDDVYEAPNMPAKDDGTPFFGWVGNNGLFLRPGERMTVGSMNITFQPVYREPNYYMVNFYDGKNNLILSEKIVDGGAGQEPSVKDRDAKMGQAIFLGWDRDFAVVHSDINVYGIYAEGGKIA